MSAVLGMVATGLALFTVIFLSPSLRTGGVAAAATPAPVSPSPVPVAAPAPQAADASPPRSVGAWVSALFAPRKPAEDAAPAVALPDLSLPDPQAATRVQSFSCAGALSSSRSLICTRWDLATADYNLALLYRGALARSRDPRALRRARAAWLKRLDLLGADAPRILQHIDSFERDIAAR